MKQIILLISMFALFSAFSFAQKSTQQKTKQETNKTDSQNSPVKILYKPRAAYPTPFEGGTVCISGIVRLRVRFLDSGEIGDIFVVSGLPYGANENAIAAARKIKFR